MKIRRLGWYSVVGVTGVWAMACGGGGPDIDKTTADFENPTGQTSNQDGVLAAANQRDTSGPVLSLGGGLSSSFGLTAVNKDDAFRTIAPGRVYEGRLKSALYAFQRSRGLPVSGELAKSLDDSESTGCDEAADTAFQEAYSDALTPSALSGGSASGHASFTQDLSECSGGSLTGSQSVDIDLQVEDSQATIKISMHLDNVCSTSGEHLCATGDMLWQAEATSGSSSASSFTFVAAWDMDTTRDDNGTSRQAHLQGGIRLTYQDEVAKFEYLFYVTSPDGEEWSYVFSFSTDGTGATLEVRGSDGELSCTFNGDGSGSCQGTNSEGEVNYSWDAAEWESVDQDESWYDG